MAQPAWFEKQLSIKKIANKKEKIVYKHILSGALDWKGDFSDKTSCIDLKATDKASIRITENMCDKILADTLQMGKQNAVLILDLPNFYIVAKVQKKDKK